MSHVLLKGGQADGLVYAVEEDRPSYVHLMTRVPMKSLFGEPTEIYPADSVTVDTKIVRYLDTGRVDEFGHQIYELES